MDAVWAAAPRFNSAGLEAFTALALRAGWKIAKSIDRPLSHDVLLKKV